MSNRSQSGVKTTVTDSTQMLAAAFFDQLTNLLQSGQPNTAQGTYISYFPGQVFRDSDLQSLTFSSLGGAAQATPTPVGGLSGVPTKRGGYSPLPPPGSVAAVDGARNGGSSDMAGIESVAIFSNIVNRPPPRG